MSNGNSDSFVGHSSVFNAFRKNKAPTLYPDNKTPWLGDVIEGGFAFCCVVLIISFLIIVPGIRGKEKFFVVIRVCFTVFVGAVIIVSLWAQSWEVGAISNVHTQYKAGIKEYITADVGLYIGLRGINITLKADNTTTQVTRLHHEKINYNEHFSWRWEQGRAGFGPFAGRFNQEFREAQRQGAPYPILWVAEYFTVDGEGIRWGRHYRLAGWYSHIMLWLAFTFLMIAVVMTYIFIRYAIYSLCLCGTCILISIIIFATLRNPIPLKIFFPGTKIEPVKGWAFILCTITGCLAIVAAFVLFMLDWLRHDAIVAFFGIDSLQDADEEVQLADDKKVYDSDDRLRNGPDAQAPEVNASDVVLADDSDKEDQEENAHPQPVEDVKPPRYRSRDNRVTKMFKKTRRSAEPPPRPTRHRVTYEQDVGDDDAEDYENATALAQSGEHLNMKSRKPQQYRGDQTTIDIP